MANKEVGLRVRTAEKSSRFSMLPSDCQLEIRRYLEIGDFRSAKALYDARLASLTSSA